MTVIAMTSNFTDMHIALNTHATYSEMHMISTHHRTSKHAVLLQTPMINVTDSLSNQI